MQREVQGYFLGNQSSTLAGHGCTQSHTFVIVSRTEHYGVYAAYSNVQDAVASWQQPYATPYSQVGPMRSRIRLSCGKVTENGKGDSVQHIEGRGKRDKHESHKRRDDVNLRLLTTHKLFNTKGMGTPKALNFPH